MTTVALGTQVLTMTSSERIMGSAFVNHWLTSTVGWAIAAFILAVNASDVWEFAQSELSGVSWVAALLGIIVVAYVIFVIYLTVGPKRCATSSAGQAQLTVLNHPVVHDSVSVQNWIRSSLLHATADAGQNTFMCIFVKCPHCRCLCWEVWVYLWTQTVF